MKATLQRFYVLKLTIIIGYTWDYLQNPPITEASWLWPVGWMQYLSDPKIGSLGITAVAMVLSTICIMKPYNVGLKILEMVFFLLFMAFNHSYDQIHHGVHGTILASLFISLINEDEARAKLLFRSAVSLVLFTYFLSGLWKLRFALEAALAAGSLAPLEGTLSYQLARNILTGGEKTQLALTVMELGGVWQFLIWAGVIIFELLCGPAIFKPATYRICGICIICFHLSVFFTMGISFLEAEVLALILMVIPKQQT